MNTLLTSMVNDVISLTSRPDLSAEIKVAVRAATLRAHHSDYFWRDWEEYSLRFDTPALIQKVKLQELIPRYRTIRHLRKFDGSEAGDFLLAVTPEESLDSYKRNRLDVFYTAGDQLNIRSSTNLEYILLGCYISPDTGDETYDSWIAKIYPNAIVNDAARIIFKSIGYDEQAAVYTEMVREDYLSLKTNFIQQTGN